MSTWTHVNGCIRIDGIPSTTPGADYASLCSILGKTYTYEDPPEIRAACSVPRGSEESLQYKIIKAGDGIVLWTVPVWGDLRDYDDVEEIRTWWKKVTEKSGLLIRSAILEIEVEGKRSAVFQYKYED